MNQPDRRKIILDFIRKQALAVVSTVNAAGTPEAAVLEFSETPDLEIIFDTFSSYRKYKNLQTSPYVAFVIGWDEDITVQYEGVARELSGEDLQKYQKIHLAKLPGSAKFAKMDMIRYFLVTPKWIRYSDLSVKPWNVFEIKF